MLKRPLPNASKPVAKRAKTEVGLLEVDDPALAEHVDKHASSARTLRSDEYSFAIPNGSVHKQMQKAVLKGTVCGFDGELLNLGYYLNALHKECFKRAKADPSQRDPDYMQVCKELGLNALLQGVANAVAGQHAKERVYDKTSINTFFHNMMGAHNLQATRYRAPLGAIMKAQGQTQTTIRTTNKYNMTESPDTAMRYLNKALVDRAESVVRRIGAMPGTVNLQIDDFTRMWRAILNASEEIYESAATASVLVFPCNLSPNVAHPTEADILPYKLMANPEVVLTAIRQLSQLGDYQLLRKQYLPEGALLMPRTPGATSIKGRVLIEQLPSSVHTDQEVFDVLLNAVRIVHKARSDGELFIMVGDWPIISRVICIHHYAHSLTTVQLNALTPEQSEAIAGLKRLVPMWAQFHGGKSSRKADGVTFFEHLFRPIFAACHKGAVLSSAAVKNTDLMQYMHELIIYAWDRRATEIKEKFEAAKATASIEVAYFRYMMLAIHLAVDVDGFARGNHMEAWEAALAAGVAVLSAMGKTSYCTAMVATLTFIAHWRCTNPDLIELLLRNLCQYNEIRIEYYHGLLAELVRLLRQGDATSIQRAAELLDAVHSDTKKDYFKTKSTRTARKPFVERKSVEGQLLIVEKFLVSMAMAICESPTSIDDAVQLHGGHGRLVVSYKTKVFGTIYPNQLPMAFARPSYSVMCERNDCDGHVCRQFVRLACGHIVDECEASCAALRKALIDGASANDARDRVTRGLCGRDECKDGAKNALERPVTLVRCCAKDGCTDGGELEKLSANCPHYAHVRCFDENATECFVCVRLEHEMVHEKCKNACKSMTRDLKLSAGFLRTDEAEAPAPDSNAAEHDDTMDNDEYEDEDLPEIPEYGAAVRVGEASADFYKKLVQPAAKSHGTLKTRALNHVADEAKAKQTAMLRSKMFPRPLELSSRSAPTAKQVEAAAKAEQRANRRADDDEDKWQAKKRAEMRKKWPPAAKNAVSARRTLVKQRTEAEQWCDETCTNPTVTADTEYANCTICSVWIHDQCLLDNVNVADLSGNVVYLCQFCEFVNDYGSAPSQNGWGPAQTISVPAAH